MCEDQGMAITSWASLGGGQLTTKEQRERLKNDPDAGRGYYEATENDIEVCEVLEDMANKKNATLQDIISRPQPVLTYATTNRSLGSCTTFPPVDLRLPHCWRANSRTREANAKCGEHSPFE